MKKTLKRYIGSTPAKRVFLLLALLVLLFFVCNDLFLPWYVNSPGEVKVPSVIGLTVADATHRMDSLGLEPRAGDTLSDRRFKIGTVINQNPSPGRTVNRGRRVYFTISGGEPLVTVPNLRGRTLRDAKFQLERSGLKLGASESQPSDSYPENTIVSQQIGPGERVRRGVYISVVISAGTLSEKVTVPDVRGKTFRIAQQMLTAAGLKVGNVSYQPMPDLLPNTVVDQFPRAGERVASGQSVDLFVVQGAERIEEY